MSQAFSIQWKVTVVTPKITKNLKKGSKNRTFSYKSPSKFPNIVNWRNHNFIRQVTLGDEWFNCYSIMDVIYKLAIMIVCCRRYAAPHRHLTSTVTCFWILQQCRVNENESYWDVVVCRSICNHTYLLRIVFKSPVQSGFSTKFWCNCNRTGCLLFRFGGQLATGLKKTG